MQRLKVIVPVDALPSAVDVRELLGDVRLLLFHQLDHPVDLSAQKTKFRLGHPWCESRDFGQDFPQKLMVERLSKFHELSHILKAGEQLGHF
jgi:hypothetical protein